VLQASFLGLIAVGQTFVIISGGIDLSVGSMLALGGVTGRARAAGRVAAGVVTAGRGVRPARPRAGAPDRAGQDGPVYRDAGRPARHPRPRPRARRRAAGPHRRGIAVCLVRSGSDTRRCRADRHRGRRLRRGRAGPRAHQLRAGHLRHRRERGVGEADGAARGPTKIIAYTTSGALAGLAGALLAARISAGDPNGGWRGSWTPSPRWSWGAPC
jgi:ribose transport system permease protein